MTKKAINYENTIIYKICCLDPEVKEIYVGHTTDFTNRKSHHKSNCNNPNNKGYNYKVYQYIRVNAGWSNFSMVMIERFPCKDGLEAHTREQFFITELHSTLNTISAIQLITRQEYNQASTCRCTSWLIS